MVLKKTFEYLQHFLIINLHQCSCFFFLPNASLISNLSSTQGVGCKNADSLEVFVPSSHHLENTIFFKCYFHVSYLQFISLGALVYSLFFQFTSLQIFYESGQENGFKKKSLGIQNCSNQMIHCLCKLKECMTNFPTFHKEVERFGFLF